jgi:hypothetical protein
VFRESAVGGVAGLCIGLFSSCCHMRGLGSSPRFFQLGSFCVAPAFPQRIVTSLKQ